MDILNRSAKNNLRGTAKMSVRAAMFFVAAIALTFVPAANAVQFDSLDPGFTQQIVIGPLTGGGGITWTSGGNMLVKDGANILEYSLGTTTYNGTSVHPVAVTHNIPGLLSGLGSGAGMATGLDGYIYVPTNIGLQRFSATLTGSATTLPGTVAGPGYGVTTLPDGRIAYCAGSTPSDVYIYNPSSGTNTWIYSAPSGQNIDDIEASATGAIALAGQMGSSITIISNTGTVINNLTGLAHHPDGLAFGDGVTANWLYSNNNDGSITQYQLGPGYSGTPVMVDIALQTLASGKAYGDLAAVGPDCAFYVSQYENGSLNGATPGTGTHWDNGSTTSEASIVRIAAFDRLTGAEYCGFGSATETVPEPGTLLLLTAAAVPLLLRIRWTRKVRARRSAV
jgi:hypothetical protein